MRITKARFGFATNSSSSHSIVFTDDPIPDIVYYVYKLKNSIPKRKCIICNHSSMKYNHCYSCGANYGSHYDYDLDKEVFVCESNRYIEELDPQTVVSTQKNYSSMEFGWSNFILTTDEEKMRYLAAQLNGMINRQIIYDITGVDISNDYKAENYGYVDHQSRWVFPYDYNSDTRSVEFILDLKKWLLQPNLVILGGNDNSYDFEKFSVVGYELPIADLPGQLVCRKDSNGYVLFNQYNGTKFRIEFENNKVSDLVPSPELVDVKITNFCDHIKAPCWKYCYQGSNNKGHHANIESIKNIVSVLSEMKIFEVALGGGETTKHPQFIDILKLFNDAGIVPNFTSRSLDWYKDREKIFPLIGGMAFSVSSIDDVNAIAEQDWGQNKRKVNFQIVHGTISKKELRNVLNKISEFNYEASITFLKYKSVGRGNKQKYSFNIVKFIQKYAENVWMKFGIDTPLANEYRGSLIQSRINSRLYDIEEGITSCYIDAVSQLIGKSSYCEKYYSYEDLTEEALNNLMNNI